MSALDSNPEIGAEETRLGERGPRLVADNTGLIATNLGQSFKRRPVLRDVNVSVQRGEAVRFPRPDRGRKATPLYITTGSHPPPARPLPPAAPHLPQPP